MAGHMAVIGAGPAGLAAAEVLAQSGCAVTVYDRMPTVGRKLLMAGRGGLNLTHSEPANAFLARYGSASEWLKPSLNAYPPAALREWCHSLGEETFIGSSGRVFPRSLKAAPLLRAWLRRLDALGVRFQLRRRWLGWEGEALLFTDPAGQSFRVRPDACLLALGGASWPRLGSDGSWTAILAQAGVAIAPLRPANCGFTADWSASFAERFAGTPLKPLAITHNGVTRQGEAMLTAQGLEGGVIYALGAALRNAIEHHGATTLHLDLRPGMPQEALAAKLQSRGGHSMSNYLRKAGFAPVAVSLLREVTPPDALASLPPSPLAARLKALPVTLTGTTGISRAISTAGGIERGALTEELMLKARPGLFAAGEMLDWEAPTGGYLLQACFSTGTAAAHGMLRYLAAASIMISTS